MTLEKHYIARKQRLLRDASGRFNRSGLPWQEELAEVLVYLFTFRWLQTHVHPTYREKVIAFSKNPANAFLTPLLLASKDAADFVRRYFAHWAAEPLGDPRGDKVKNLIVAHEDPEQAEAVVLAAWSKLGLFREPELETNRRTALRQKESYKAMTGEAVTERLALIDALPNPDTTPRPKKIGVIPVMACPQSCRHCLFVWRPPMKDPPPPGGLFQQIGGLSQNVLFTGGDLTRRLPDFHQAIREMSQVSTFAILLNGDAATSFPAAQNLLKEMDAALAARPARAVKAHIMLQVSFDEYHQEILHGRGGELRERIPVERIANLVEAAPRFPRIQLALLHKQNRLNFSNDVFTRGVFARLAEELQERGLPLRVLSIDAKGEKKSDPVDPATHGDVIREAWFRLERHPERPILFQSSAIDAMGRAAALDPSEFLNNRKALQAFLDGTAPEESFDIDPMFWLNGLATPFAANHINLGNVYEEGLDVVLARFAKDPLLNALNRFDQRLLAMYGEIREDFEEIKATASSPHHLFHRLTREAEVRLELTRRLLESSGDG